MATLDDLENIKVQPLDVNTPVVSRIGTPTPQFVRHQNSFSKVIQATGAGAAAAIRQEGEVRAEADNASAILVDAVTAEALGFTAAILMKAEVGINPSGVLARYQIVVSLDPGGAPVKSGLYFDVVEDALNPGQYLGQIHLDADKIKLGRSDQAGMFPFRIEAGIVYIENAVIKNLSIGTEKVAIGAITDLVIAYGGATGVGSVMVGTVVPILSGNDTGVLIQMNGFMDKPYDNPGNFGYWQIQLRRNGGTIASSPALFYDDNFAYPISMMFADQSPGDNPYYDFIGVGLSGPTGFNIGSSTMVCTRFKR